MALWDWENTSKSRWSFVVDTNSYAGNFDRDLAGFMVGQTDLEVDEGRCAKFISMYVKDLPNNPFEELVGSRVDDHGDDQVGRAPMALAPTPGWGSNGKGKEIEFASVSAAEAKKYKRYPAYFSLAIFLTRKPKPSELKLLKERALAFSKLPRTSKIKITACRLVEEQTVLTSTTV